MATRRDNGLRDHGTTESGEQKFAQRRLLAAFGLRNSVTFRISWTRIADFPAAAKVKRVRRLNRFRESKSDQKYALVWDWPVSVPFHGQPCGLMYLTWHDHHSLTFHEILNPENNRTQTKA